MLSLRNIRASLASFIQPTGIVPVAGNLPSVQLVTPPAQVAVAAPVASATGTPGQLIRANPADLASTIEAVRVLRTASPAARRQALAMPVAARPATLSRLAPAAKSISPEVDDDDLPSPPPADDGVAAVIKQLQDCLKMLKSLLPADSENADEGDEASAVAALTAGRKSEALILLDSAISKVGQRVALQNSRLAARSRLFKNIRGTCAPKPVGITADDDLATRRAKARSAMFSNL